MTAGGSYSALYLGPGLVPNANNFSFLNNATGATVYLNTASGGTTNFSIAGSASYGVGMITSGTTATSFGPTAESGNGSAAPVTALGGVASRWTTAYVQSGINAGTSTTGAGTQMNFTSEYAKAGSAANGADMGFYLGQKDGAGTVGVFHFGSDVGASHTDFMKLSTTEMWGTTTNVVALGDTTHAFKASFINGIDTDSTNTTMAIGGTNAAIINEGKAASPAVVNLLGGAGGYSFGGAGGGSVNTQTAKAFHIVATVNESGASGTLASNSTAGSAFCPASGKMTHVVVDYVARHTATLTDNVGGTIYNLCYNSGGAVTCGTTGTSITAISNGALCVSGSFVPTIVASGACFQVNYACTGNTTSTDVQLDIYADTN